MSGDGISESQASSGGLLSKMTSGLRVRYVLRNTALLSGGKGVSAVLGLGYLALGAHALGAQGLGHLLIIHSLAVAFTGLVGFKSWEMIVRYGSRYIANDNIGQLRNLIKLGIILDFSSAVVGFGLGVAFVLLFSATISLPDDLRAVAAVYCVLILFDLKQTPAGILRLFGRYDLLTLHSLITPVLRTVGAAAAWFLDGGVAAFVAVWLVAGIVSAIAQFCLAWAEMGRRGVLYGMGFRLRGIARGHENIWRFAFSTNLHGTLLSFGSHIVLLVIGGVIGAAAVSQYKIAQEVADALVKLTQLLNQVVYPELSRLASAGLHAALAKAVAFWGALAFGGSIIVIAVMASVGKPVLAFVFGASLVTSNELLILLTIAAAIASVHFVLDSGLYALGRPGIVLRVKVISSIVQFGGLWVLLPEFGLPGAAYAAMAGNLLIVICATAALSDQIKRISKKRESGDFKPPAGTIQRARQRDSA